MQIRKALADRILQSPVEERLALLVDEVLRVRDNYRFLASTQTPPSNFRPKQRRPSLWICSEN